MKVSRTYGGNHFKGEEMDTTPLLLTIDDVSVKEFEGDGGGRKEKIVLAFRETDKTMVVNFTNASIIAGFLGDETDSWIGHKIVVFRDKTRYAGKMVPCVSVRAPKQVMRGVQSRQNNAMVTQSEADRFAAEDDGQAMADEDASY
jgi:hypothetical protein